MKTEKLKINGITEVSGMKFCDIEGGFGEDKKSMLVKDIANIHGRDLGKINELINNNRKRFKDSIDIIDLKNNEFVLLLKDSGIFTQNAINASKNIYALSERGYSKLLKLLEDDMAWEQYEKLVDGYFKMRKEQKTNSTFNTTSSNLERLQLEQQGLKFALDILKPGQAFTVKMLKEFNTSQGLSTVYFPNYVDEQEGHSATELLKKYDVSLTTIKFNKLMLQYGYLEECTRKSTNKKGFKHYKKLTEKGLSYGKNVISSRGTEKETQPLYYENTFKELTGKIFN